MYRVGAISSIALLVSITFAIAAFFIWPYKLGGASVQEIFALLHNDRLAGLMSLELQMLLVQPVMVLTSFALYAALKQVNESFALIALALGIMGNLLMFSARPVNELVYLSDRYIGTASEILKNQYLAAGESYLALYEGTGFTAATIFISVAGVINALLMLKSRFFSKAAGSHWRGIVRSGDQYFYSRGWSCPVFRGDDRRGGLERAAGAVVLPLRVEARGMIIK